MQPKFRAALIAGAIVVATLAAMAACDNRATMMQSASPPSGGRTASTPQRHATPRTRERGYGDGDQTSY